jgi:hypothetical protein
MVIQPAEPGLKTNIQKAQLGEERLSNHFVAITSSAEQSEYLPPADGICGRSVVRLWVKTKTYYPYLRKQVVFMDKGEQTRFGSALPVESLEPELCKEGVYVFAHRVIVVATRAISTIGVIEGDNPNDLPTIGGIITWEVKAIQIFVGISRRIFFIARNNGEYDIDG